MSTPVSPREAALRALDDLLKEALPRTSVARNQPLPETIDREGYIVLFDGGGNSEVLIGSIPPIHSWLWTSEIVLAVPGGEPEIRSERLDNLLDAVSRILLANPNPVATVHSAIVSTEIDTSYQPSPGVVPISVASLGVLLEYSTINPTG